MLKVQEIRELIRLVDQSSIDEFEYENEGLKLVMKKNKPVEVSNVALPVQAVPVPNPVPLTVTATEVKSVVEEKSTVEQASIEKASEVEKAANASLHKITSPMVGTFYQSSSPEADAYVNVGSKVKKDSVVCIVEAMKLFNEIEADVDGEIVEILVKNGQLVEFGQPLFLVKKD